MPFLEIENLRVPRTREKNFKPVFLQSLKNGLFSFEELILAMYQGGCSTRDISKTLRNLFEMKHSSFSVSKIVSVVKEEIEKIKRRKIEKWYPVLYVDGVYLKIRRGSVSDGLPGLRDAIKQVYPFADFQHCILHKVRASLRSQL